MKTICIAGVNPAELSFIEAIFTQAGMALALPAQRDETLTINRWHDQIQSRIKEIAGEQGPGELGRVWEQLRGAGEGEEGARAKGKGKGLEAGPAPGCRV